MRVGSGDAGRLDGREPDAAAEVAGEAASRRREDERRVESRRERVEQRRRPGAVGTCRRDARLPEYSTSSPSETDRRTLTIPAARSTSAVQAPPILPAEPGRGGEGAAAAESIGGASSAASASNSTRRGSARRRLPARPDQLRRVRGHVAPRSAWRRASDAARRRSHRDCEPEAVSASRRVRRPSFQAPERHVPVVARRVAEPLTERPGSWQRAPTACRSRKARRTGPASVAAASAARRAVSARRRFGSARTPPTGRTFAVRVTRPSTPPGLLSWPAYEHGVGEQDQPDPVRTSAIPTTIPNTESCSAIYETLSAVASAVSLIQMFRWPFGTGLSSSWEPRPRRSYRPRRRGWRRTGSGPSPRRSGHRLPRARVHRMYSEKQRASSPCRSPHRRHRIREIDVLEPGS